MNKQDLRFEYIRGKGPGGQNKNKVCSCVKVTHIPTGITVTIDGRDQHRNKMMALKELERRLYQHHLLKKQQAKKAIRDEKIKPSKYIRTYNYVRQKVLDHRSGKQADIREVMEKGRIDLLR